MATLLFSCAILVISSIVDAAEFTNTISQLANVKVGTPFSITWTSASGPVTLLLKDGSPNNLQNVETIASGLTGTSYSWTPALSLPSGFYAFEIDDSSGPNYSVQFNLAGASVSSSPGSTSASTSASSISLSPSTKLSSSITSTSSTLTSSTFSQISSSTSPSSSSTSSTTSSTSSISSPNTPTSQTASPTPSGESGLSTGSKVAIGVGVSFGVLLFAAFGAFAFWYGRRSASQKNKDSDTAPSDKAELGSGVPQRKELEDTNITLNETEKSELERRRRAAELEGAFSPTNPRETINERAELEALRAKGNAHIEKEGVETYFIQ